MVTIVACDGCGFQVALVDAVRVKRMQFGGLQMSTPVRRTDGEPGGWLVGPTEADPRRLAHLDGPLARKVARATTREKMRRTVRALRRLGVRAEVG